jgi:hypothetical protein
MKRKVKSFLQLAAAGLFAVVDTQLTTKARRDLEDIIELSKQIKKSSDRFCKDAP